MTGYDRKRLTLQSDREVTITVEVEIAGNGTWVLYEHFKLSAGQAREHEFPEAFSACWVRFTADSDCVASGVLQYD